MSTLITPAKQASPSRRRLTVSLSWVAGTSYAAAWIISLAVGAPNPSVAATGRQVVASFAGHGVATLAMFALAEGIASVALIAVVTSAARVARQQGKGGAGLTAAAFGIAVAIVSWAELALGSWLIGGPVADRRADAAGTLYHAIMRIDGAKMLLLAVMALAITVLASNRRILPRWLAPLGVLLAAALIASGLGYLLLAPGLAGAVIGSGILLLIVVCATGMTLESTRSRAATASVRSVASTTLSSRADQCG